MGTDILLLIFSSLFVFLSFLFYFFFVFHRLGRCVMPHASDFILSHSVAYGFISIAGILGNSAVLVVVAKSPQMRTLTNQFLANLAVADLMVNILVGPATLIGNLFPGE